MLATMVPEAAQSAQPLLSRAVQGRSSTYARSKALDLIGLAATHFQMPGGELEQGVAVGDAALRGTHTLNSPRTLARLRPFDTATAPFAKEPVVAEFRERLHLAMAVA